MADSNELAFPNASEVPPPAGGGRENSGTERLVPIAFAAAGVITVLLCVLTYQSSLRLHDAAEWVGHTQQVLRAISNMRAAVTKQQVGTNGFVLTGDPRFVEQKSRTAADVTREFAALRALVADNPLQSERLTVLEPRLRAAAAFDGRVVALRQGDGLAAATALVAGGEGLRSMEEIDAALVALRDTERGLLDERSASMNAAQQSGVTIVALLFAGALATLACGYAAVTRALRARRRALRRLDATRAYAESIVNTVREPLVVLDAEQRVVSANRAYYRFFATTAAATEGHPPAHLTAEPSTQAALQTLQAGALACDASFENLEITADVPDRGPRTLQLNGRRLQDSDAARVLLSIEDISDRRRVEQLVVERRTLERTNAELQEFAYVASHDLQEPLRKMRAFAERLTDRCAAGLSEEARDYLTRIARGAERMQRLIDDLLAFSRVTTRAAPFGRVDLAALVREVLSDLEPRLEASGGEVELGALPTIEADPTQMRQLLQNLLVNALKFHRPDASPHVQIGARIDGATCELRVADDGIGFDEKYLDRIFTIFQRLHGRNEYEGTGLGLAICRKIAERHRGRITARSRPGAGATFIVTLPVRQPGIQEAA